MQWFAQAPANIALIKYMGKKDEAQNLPANPSLSYTLTTLLSTVTLEQYNGVKDLWEPLETPGMIENFKLSAAEQAKFIHHLERLKQYFSYQGAFVIRSTNNFPMSSGLASSASSFAALTKCACLALAELTQSSMPDVVIQANLSRLGSGSSCRSFFAPWTLWDEEGVSAVQIPYDDLHHEVIIISHQEKKISSSEAHRLVKTSNQFSRRIIRAEENLKLLLDALVTKNWVAAYELCWREFHDMHQLFTTCATPFNYITADGQKVLDLLQKLWQEQGDGPLVTMDAGPNIHLLYRADQTEMAWHFRQNYLLNNYDVL